MIGAGPRGAMGFGVFETLKPAVGKLALFKDNPAAGNTPSFHYFFFF